MLDRITALVEVSEIVKVSDEDLAWLYPDVDPVTVARQWLALGQSLVVVTRGGDGVVAVGPWCDGNEGSVSPYGDSSGRGVVIAMAQPTVVVDTVGAGDSFMTGLIHALWHRDLLV